MLMLYQEGRSWVHRAPSGVKFGVLLVASTALFIISHVWALLIACVAVAIVWLTTGLPLRAVLRQFRSVVVLILFFAAVQWLSQGLDAALVMVFRMVALVGAATLVSATTRTSDLIRFLETLLRPLRRWVPVGRIAFMVSMVFRFVPLLEISSREIRAAAWARGLDRNPVALLLPLMVETLRTADGIVEAMYARGMDDL